MSSLNKHIEMDYEVGKSSSPPKLIEVEDYGFWKESFESFAKSNDMLMWECITEGYIHPTSEMDGKTKPTPYSMMKENQKKVFDAENKAWSSIKTSLPREILYLTKQYKTSKELWEALERKYYGYAYSYAKIKKNRGKQLEKRSANMADPGVLIVQQKESSCDLNNQVEKTEKVDQAVITEITKETKAEVDNKPKTDSEAAFQNSLELHSVVKHCMNCAELTSLVESNRAMSIQLEKLTKENEMLTQRLSELQHRTGEDAKDAAIDIDHSISKETSSDNVKLPETTESEGGETSESNVEFVENKGDDRLTRKQTEHLTNNQSSPKAFEKKAFRRRSCFRCHEKGHVVSCCPNKNGATSHKRVRKNKSPVKSSAIQERMSTSQSSFEKSIGAWKRKSRETSRFQRFDRSRSVSPQTTSSSDESSRNQSPRYVIPNRRQHVLNNQPRVQQNSGLQNQRSMFQRRSSNSLFQRSSGNGYRQRQRSNSPRESKTPERCNGYLKEFTFVENGISKTVTAWVSLDN